MEALEHSTLSRVVMMIRMMVVVRTDCAVIKDLILGLSLG